MTRYGNVHAAADLSGRRTDQVLVIACMTTKSTSRAADDRLKFRLNGLRSLLRQNDEFLKSVGKT